MNNPKIFQVKCAIDIANIKCEVAALVRPGANAQQFHVLTLQPCTHKAIASVVSDFAIEKQAAANGFLWVHAHSAETSELVAAIGAAIDKRIYK